MAGSDLHRHIWLVWPTALLGAAGGLLGLLFSIVVLTMTHDHKAAKRGAFLCVAAFLLGAPWLLPMG